MINTFIQKSIIILETSSIIQKGLYRILVESDLNCSISQVFGFDELKSVLSRKEVDIAIINPGLIQNNMNIFKHFKKNYPNTNWLALHYSYIDALIMNEFNAVLQISDSSELIIEKIKSIHSNDDNKESIYSILISEREIEVIKLLVKGLPNKEIADILNLSVHTVISHRKNISQKTGIKSLAALTIFAVSKNLINLEEYKFELP